MSLCVFESVCIARKIKWFQVSRHLFKWTREVSYADYYERALTNGVLSIQRGTDPGVMIYMLPLGFGVSKAKTGHSWGTPLDSFWCCYGTGIRLFCLYTFKTASHCTIFFANSTLLLLNFLFCLLGIESFSKLGDSIYFEEQGKDPSLYIIQYISSSFNWESGKILLNQKVVPASSWDPYLRVTFTFSPVEVNVTLFYGMCGMSFS